MPKPIEQQCKICQLYTEDRLKIEEKLKQGWSLDKTLNFITEELAYPYISRSSLNRHKKHMDKVNPPYYEKPKKLVWTAKSKSIHAWYDINRYRYLK